MNAAQRRKIERANERQWPLGTSVKWSTGGLPGNVVGYESNWVSIQTERGARIATRPNELRHA